MNCHNSSKEFSARQPIQPQTTTTRHSIVFHVTITLRLFKCSANRLNFPQLSLLRPSDTEVKFFVGNENYSPNPRKPFIHTAVESGLGHHIFKYLKNRKAHAFSPYLLVRMLQHFYQRVNALIRGRRDPVLLTLSYNQPV